MIKLFVKTIGIVGVLVSMTGCITIQAGAQQRHVQPINYGGQQQGYQQQGQVQQQNGGCAPGSHRIGTNPQGGAHCEWNRPQQGQQQQRYYPQQQGYQQQQQKNCNGAGYRSLTTGILSC